MQLDQRFGDRQTEPGAADALRQAGIAAREALEDVLELILGYPRSVIAHRNLQLGIRYPGRDPDIRSFRGILMRVRNQIHQNLANPVGLDV